MPALSTDVEPLERPTQLADLKAARRELADNLLAAARGELPFEYPETAGELGLIGANRRATAAPGRSRPRRSGPRTTPR
jgi:hypothetical protein